MTTYRWITPDGRKGHSSWAEEFANQPAKHAHDCWGAVHAEMTRLDGELAATQGRLRDAEAQVADLRKELEESERRAEERPSAKLRAALDAVLDVCGPRRQFSEDGERLAFEALDAYRDGGFEDPPPAPPRKRSPDDDTTVSHPGPDLDERIPLPGASALDQELSREHARQDTIDDVEIWLEAWAIVAPVTADLPSDRAPDPTAAADERLRSFRNRWPRRDGKDPLEVIR